MQRGTRREFKVQNSLLVPLCIPEKLEQAGSEGGVGSGWRETAPLPETLTQVVPSGDWHVSAGSLGFSRPPGSTEGPVGIAIAFTPLLPLFQSWDHLCPWTHCLLPPLGTVTQYLLGTYCVPGPGLGTQGAL